MTAVIAIVMLLYQGGNIIEYTYHDGISSCLKQKREIDRLGFKGSKYTRYSCERRKVEFFEDTKDIVRILD